MFNKSQRKFARTISEIINCNPFLPRRIELERQALGKEFSEQNAEWNLHPSQHRLTPNLEKMQQVAEGILDLLVESESVPEGDDLALHLDLVRFVLFNRFRNEMGDVATQGGKLQSVFQQFREQWMTYCPPGRFQDSVTEQVPHIFALLCQIRRAFDNVFGNLIGSSDVIIQLRANVWRSIFTHDVRRFHDSMFSAMADFPTLITGPTGTGKELVARAIGQSGYVPFDPDAAKWETPPDGLFVSLNLSALSPTLIESELFGHRKGAFTGATSDRIGWLEACPQFGAVFLDEIGELDPEIQVKLLRVVQDRTFQRLGDTEPRRFHGRIIAATNRDLATEIEAGRFRLDFYYRLCADQIQTPSLAERCTTESAELKHLVEHLLARIVSDQSEAQLAEQCITWIREHLGNEYPWPGNVRELDQCIRSWLIRQDYTPLTAAPCAESDERRLRDSLKCQSLSADELTSLYCQVSYEQTGSYVKTAKNLKLDRRTVKARVDRPDAPDDD